jgi:hypothetical protein
MITNGSYSASEGGGGGRSEEGCTSVERGRVSPKKRPFGEYDGRNGGRVGPLQLHWPHRMRVGV